MPVTPNLMRVRRPAPSVCPSPLTGRSYLALLESGGSLHAYRYTDGVYQETLRSQAISGFNLSDLADFNYVFRVHASGDVVVFEAKTGFNRSYVTWDISAGTFSVLDFGTTGGDPMVADGAGNFAWAWRRSNGILESYRATIGASGTVVPGRENGDPSFWGFIETPPDEYSWIFPLLPTPTGIFAAALFGLDSEGRLSRLPSGPAAAVTGLPELFTSNLESGQIHAGGSLTFARRQPDGSATSAAGILAADGTWSRWTPLAWDDLGILQYAQPSPSGNEWLLQASIGGVTKLARLANGAISAECPLPSFTANTAPEGVPTHFLCRDN